MEINSLQRRYLHKGFSLTELMASIVIVGVLMAIVIPNYKNIRFGADETKATVNLHSIYLAQKEFHADNATYDSFSIVNNKYVLQTYVDFSLDDGCWRYQIQSWSDDGFVVRAIHYTSSGDDGPIRDIDQTGTITKGVL